MTDKLLKVFVHSGRDKVVYKPVPKPCTFSISEFRLWGREDRGQEEIFGSSKFYQVRFSSI